MHRKLFVFLTLITLTSVSAAHDMWLVTAVPGAEGKICARIGERFPDTVNAPTADRITTFQLITDQGAEKLNGEFKDKQFCANANASAAGVAEMIVQPRLNKIDAKRFREFVHGEGLEHIVKPDAGKQGDVTYLYSRYSKLITPGRSKAYSRMLGHALEVVPLDDPSSSSRSLRVRILFRGKPLAGAQVAAVNENASPEAHQFPVVTRTDKDGNAELKLTKSGLWYARLIHTIPADDPEFQWHHYFATLTFTTVEPDTKRK